MHYAEKEELEKRRCADCGRFIPRKNWVPTTRLPDGSRQFPLCDNCASEYDPYPPF